VPKEKPINVFSVGHFDLNLDFSSYGKLKELNLKNKALSSFLHKLDEMWEKTHSEIFLNVEIFNSRGFHDQVFKGVKERHFTVKQLVNWYKLSV
jgi:hypothetical protein